MQNGTNLVSTFVYNSRLQPCWIYATTGTALPWQPTTTSCTSTATAGSILDLKYNFNLGAGDNGNVIGITNNRDTTRTQSFAYDQVNRIVGAHTSATTGANCWGETYTMDQWANMTAIGALSGYSGCTQENLSVTATTNNRLSSTGFSYDLSGNMLTDGMNTYAWNAESEMKSAAGVNYTYDGDGNRLQKSNGKIYWYGAGTEILDESDASGNFTSEYVFFGGKRIARRDVASSNIYYYADDMLGSTSKIVQAGQTTPCYDADFYPYGGERVVTSTCPQNYKFEGKERDTATGNDDFGARYYTSRLGRWLSSDWSAVPIAVPYANMANPQTLNLYAMVSDNPETFADLDGHWCSYGQNLPGGACLPPPPPPPPPTTMSRSWVTRDFNATGPDGNQQDLFIAGKDTTTVTYNPDGSVKSTQTTRTIMVWDGTQGNQQGTFLGAWQTTVGSNTNTLLSYGEGMSVIGQAAISAQTRAASPDYLGALGNSVQQEIMAHPIRYGLDAVGLALPFVEAKGVWEGVKLGAEVVHAAYDAYTAASEVRKLRQGNNP
jgi:RHS repeat-associated protein